MQSNIEVFVRKKKSSHPSIQRCLEILLLNQFHCVLFDKNEISDVFLQDLRSTLAEKCNNQTSLSSKERNSCAIDWPFGHGSRTRSIWECYSGQWWSVLYKTGFWYTVTRIKSATEDADNRTRSIPSLPWGKMLEPGKTWSFSMRTWAILERTLTNRKHKRNNKNKKIAEEAVAEALAKQAHKNDWHPAPSKLPGVWRMYHNYKMDTVWCSRWPLRVELRSPIEKRKKGSLISN